MESDNAGFNPVILAIMNTEAFTDELFPSVCILRRRGIGMFLLQRNAIRCRLSVLRINARRLCVQISFHAVLSCCLDAIDVDERVVMQDLCVII